MDRKCRAHALFISAVTLGAIQAGIESTRLQDPEKADSLESWADRLDSGFHVLPMDARCFRVWARLMVGRGNAVYEDAMIAATAKVHNLTVATRNTRDFEGFGLKLVNPFATRIPVRGAQAPWRHLHPTWFWSKRLSDYACLSDLST